MCKEKVLKPCPFCGSNSYLNVVVTETLTGEHKGDKYYDIHCVTCGNFTHFCRADSKEQLIQKWNTRKKE